MSRYSQNQRDRERLAAVAKEREQRMQFWADARNEGVREGLKMAMVAALGQATGRGAGEAIKARGNRHFGDSEWQTKARPSGEQDASSPSSPDVK